MREAVACAPGGGMVGGTHRRDNQFDESAEVAEHVTSTLKPLKTSGWPTGASVKSEGTYSTSMLLFLPAER